MSDPIVPPDQRANLTPEDLRDYYLEMGHRELEVIKERDALKQEVGILRAQRDLLIAQVRENEVLYQEQLATAQAGFAAAERRIVDLELRVRVLTQRLHEANA